MNYFADICNETLRQIELYGASFITEVGDRHTNFLMDYHSALNEAEMLATGVEGVVDFTVCRLTLHPLDGEVEMTFWDGHVVNGTATGFLRQSPPSFKYHEN